MNVLSASLKRILFYFEPDTNRKKKRNGLTSFDVAEGRTLKKASDKSEKDQLLKELKASIKMVLYDAEAEAGEIPYVTPESGALPTTDHPTFEIEEGSAEVVEGLEDIRLGLEEVALGLLDIKRNKMEKKGMRFRREVEGEEIVRREGEEKEEVLKRKETNIFEEEVVKRKSEEDVLKREEDQEEETNLTEEEVVRRAEWDLVDAEEDIVPESVDKE